jgi:hypothetical protein
MPYLREPIDVDPDAVDRRMCGWFLDDMERAAAAMERAATKLLQKSERITEWDGGREAVLRRIDRLYERLVAIEHAVRGDEDTDD